MKKKTKKQPLVSIITCVLNNKEYIKDTILSVSKQDYPNIEYIIIDGGSTDGTLEIIEENKGRISKIISEPDRGLSDAMNKGITLAEGDIIGILHSDDVYSGNSVVTDIVKKLSQTGANLCWGDLIYTSRNNLQKPIRYWRSSPYKKGLFAKGWVPAHPTLFVKKKIYEKYGKYRNDFPMAADYEWFLKILEKNKVKSCYVPKVLVKMRIGGNSNKNIKNILRGNKEIYKAWKENNLKFPVFLFFRKIFIKIHQFLNVEK